ncbi:twin-arginine translocation signal domain-containing protein [Stutzerimonas stutzeri]|uniref:twin-arginine translocation signal domain-containing protein n=1 Tax=Stutzerimonas stutzeri TaxID=316 RepID=UPI000F768FF7|nr:twin-arginine translocation signal domain-containing protein [Stutzerimonas stutzeri]RSH69239.1 twin-arginine translocation signal domain-containing protein [Stutzerimonas stutzeri]
MNNLMISRRSFIKTASIVAAAVSILPTLNMFASELTNEARMTDLERSVFDKLLKISLPTDGSSLVDPATLPVLQTLEEALLAGMEPHIRQGLRGGIGYFNDGAIKGFGAAFVNLSDADATRFCDQWTDADGAPERALAMGLKKLAVLAYWAIPNTWEPLGYGGPVSDKWKLPSLGNAPEPQV